MKCLSVLVSDSQIEKQARRQLRETTFGILFELGVPAIRAIDQVNLLTDSVAVDGLGVEAFVVFSACKNWL